MVRAGGERGGGPERTEVRGPSTGYFGVPELAPLFLGPRGLRFLTESTTCVQTDPGPTTVREVKDTQDPPTQNETAIPGLRTARTEGGSGEVWGGTTLCGECVESGYRSQVKLVLLGPGWKVYLFP